MAKEREDKISEIDMMEAIQKSGYLIEKRVAKVFEAFGYNVVPSQIIVDPETEKRREIDLVAMKINYSYESSDNVGFEVICECENNENPLVFFTHKFEDNFYVSQLKYSGFDFALEHLKRNKDQIIFPGYPLATQYCGFQKTKNGDKKWIALHLTEQHDTITKVKKSIQHRVKRYSLDTKGVYAIAGRIHYGLIVLSGDMYIWEDQTIDKGQGSLISSMAVRFRTIDYNDESNFYEQYYIDLIKEEHLKNYIQEIEREAFGFISIIENNRNQILKEIDQSMSLKTV